MNLFQFILVGTLLLFSAFFSSSETALFSLSAAQQEDIRRRSRGYSKIERLLSEPHRLIVTILLGNEFTNLLLSAVTASLIIQMYGESKSFYNVIVATPLLLLFGEITPKALAIRHNKSYAQLIAPILITFSKVITPVRAVVRTVSDKLTSLIIGNQTQPSLISEDMVLSLTREAVGEGELGTAEAHYITRIFKFGDATVDDAMIPRSNMLFVSIDTDPASVIKLIEKYRRDRLVVYEEDQDKVKGVLFARDLLTIDPSKKHSSDWLRKHVRKPFLVPETRSLLGLFYQMKQKQISIALAIDEYGGITGQITIYNVLAFIFGDTPAKCATQIKLAKKTKLNGSMEVSEFNRTYNTNLPNEHGDTLNGLLIHHHGELPQQKLCIAIDNIRFTIVKVANNRITWVLAEPVQNTLITPAEKAIQSNTKRTSNSKKDRTGAIQNHTGDKPVNRQKRGRQPNA